MRGPISQIRAGAKAARVKMEGLGKSAQKSAQKIKMQPRNATTLRRCTPRSRLQTEFLTVHRSAGLVNQAVSLNDAVGLPGLPPGHVDRGGCQLAEVDEAGSAGGFLRGKKRKSKTSDIHDGIL